MNESFKDISKDDCDSFKGQMAARYKERTSLGLLLPACEQTGSLIPSTKESRESQLAPFSGGSGGSGVSRENTSTWQNVSRPTIPAEDESDVSSVLIKRPALKDLITRFDNDSRIESRKMSVSTSGSDPSSAYSEGLKPVVGPGRASGSIHQDQRLTDSFAAFAHIANNSQLCHNSTMDDKLSSIGSRSDSQTQETRGMRCSSAIEMPKFTFPLDCKRPSSTIGTNENPEPDRINLRDFAKKQQSHNMDSMTNARDRLGTPSPTMEHRVNLRNMRTPSPETECRVNLRASIRSHTPIMDHMRSSSPAVNMRDTMKTPSPCMEPRINLRDSMRSPAPTVENRVNLRNIMKTPSPTMENRVNLRDSMRTPSPTKVPLVNLRESMGTQSPVMEPRVNLRDTIRSPTPTLENRMNLRETAMPQSPVKDHLYTVHKKDWGDGQDTPQKGGGGTIKRPLSRAGNPISVRPVTTMSGRNQASRNTPRPGRFSTSYNTPTPDEKRPLNSRNRNRPQTPLAVENDWSRKPSSQSYSTTGLKRESSFISNTQLRVEKRNSLTKFKDSVVVDSKDGERKTTAMDRYRDFLKTTSNTALSNTALSQLRSPSPAGSLSECRRTIELSKGNISPRTVNLPSSPDISPINCLDRKFNDVSPKVSLHEQLLETRRLKLKNGEDNQTIKNSEKRSMQSSLSITESPSNQLDTLFSLSRSSPKRDKSKSFTSSTRTSNQNLIKRNSPPKDPIKLEEQVKQLCLQKQQHNQTLKQHADDPYHEFKEFTSSPTNERYGSNQHSPLDKEIFELASQLLGQDELMDTDLLPTYLRDSTHQGHLSPVNYSSDEDNYSPSIKKKLRTIRNSHLLQQLQELEPIQGTGNSPKNVYTHPNHEKPNKIASMPGLYSESSSLQSPRFANSISKEKSVSPNGIYSRNSKPNPLRSPMRRNRSLSPVVSDGRRSESPSPGRLSYTTSMRSESRQSGYSPVSGDHCALGRDHPQLGGYADPCTLSTPDIMKAARTSINQETIKVDGKPHCALIMKNEDTNRFIQEYLDSSKLDPSLTTDMVTDTPPKTEDFLHDEVAYHFGLGEEEKPDASPTPTATTTESPKKKKKKTDKTKKIKKQKKGEKTATKPSVTVEKAVSPKKLMSKTGEVRKKKKVRKLLSSPPSKKIVRPDEGDTKKNATDELKSENASRAKAGRFKMSKSGIKRKPTTDEPPEAALDQVPEKVQAITDLTDAVKSKGKIQTLTSQETVLNFKDRSSSPPKDVKDRSTPRNRTSPPQNQQQGSRVLGTVSPLKNRTSPTQNQQQGSRVLGTVSPLKLKFRSPPRAEPDPSNVLSSATSHFSSASNRSSVSRYSRHSLRSSRHQKRRPKYRPVVPVSPAPTQEFPVWSRIPVYDPAASPVRQQYKMAMTYRRWREEFLGLDMTMTCQLPVSGSFWNTLDQAAELEGTMHRWSASTPLAGIDDDEYSELSEGKTTWALLKEYSDNLPSQVGSKGRGRAGVRGLMACLALALTLGFATLLLDMGQLRGVLPRGLLPTRMWAAHDYEYTCTDGDELCVASLVSPPDSNF